MDSNSPQPSFQSYTKKGGQNCMLCISIETREVRRCMNFMHQAVVVLVYTWNYSESVLQPLLQYTEQTVV